MPEPASGENTPITMVLPQFRAVDLPEPFFPEGITVRSLRWADASAWLALVRAAETLAKIPDDQFERAYGDDAIIIADRVFFALDDEGNPVGTVAAWYGTEDWEGWGRIHWLYVLPEWQNRKLGRALLSFALHRLAALGHEKVYLKTSTGRPKAIKLYERFGFDSETPDAYPCDTVSQNSICRCGILSVNGRNNEMRQ